ERPRVRAGECPQAPDRQAAGAERRDQDERHSGDSPREAPGLLLFPSEEQETNQSHGESAESRKAKGGPRPAGRSEVRVERRGPEPRPEGGGRDREHARKDSERRAAQHQRASGQRQQQGERGVEEQVASAPLPAPEDREGPPRRPGVLDVPDHERRAPEPDGQSGDRLDGVEERHFAAPRDRANREGPEIEKGQRKGEEEEGRKGGLRSGRRR